VETEKALDENMIEMSDGLARRFVLEEHKGQDGT